MAISGVHHVALSTNDMKAQIEFFTQVVGMKLAGVFPMHGVPGASHCFLAAGKDCYLSFIQMDGVHIDPVIGLSHALDAAGPVAGGAMQHICFNCDSYAEMLDLRDRLRSNGYAVLGPLEHGMSYSMYLGAPEGILLEFGTSENCEMPVEKWVDPETAALMGMDASDLERYISPPAFAGRGGAVPQPAPETSVYPTPIPRLMFDALAHLSDEDLKAALRYNAPTEQQEAAQ